MKKILIISLCSIFLLACGAKNEVKENEWNSFKLSIAEERIKRSLREPESYKMLDYKVKYKDDKVSSITIEYTAKNGFGGTNREIRTISF